MAYLDFLASNVELTVNPSPVKCVWPAEAVCAKTSVVAEMLVSKVPMNQVLAQHVLFRYGEETNICKADVFLSPNKLDVKVAKLHFSALDTELTVLARIKQGSQRQSSTF